MLIYYTDHFELPLPAGHRFPMAKYRLLRDRVAKVAGSLLREPAAASDTELARAHDAAYIDAVQSGTLAPAALRRIGFPWSAALVERSRRSAGATIAACRSALESGCGVSLAGGTHHAHRAHGEGFCVFNDAVVAARTMQCEHGVKRILIIDLDVHQGDGTAAILAGDPTVFTFSMHGRANFPFRKASSDLDVEFADATGDGSYLATLAVAMPLVIAAARPELAVYLAGADPFAGDRLGRLALSKSGLVRRDELVLDTLRAAGVAVAIVMAGGYADCIDEIVDIHFNTVASALARYGPRLSEDSLPGPCARAHSERAPLAC